MLVKTGVHSPAQFRVQVCTIKFNVICNDNIFFQGPFSNMNDFAKDFNCPVGSNMNPEKQDKCKVW